MLARLPVNAFTARGVSRATSRGSPHRTTGGGLTDCPAAVIGDHRNDYECHSAPRSVR